MNVVLIFAGGSGTRMNSKSKPKQFLSLFGKEIIIHTIENFEYNTNIDAIAVVCIESWIPYLKQILNKNSISKVNWIVPGGENGQASIFNGLNIIHENCPEDTTVLIHDGVRPLIDDSLINNCLDSVKKYGNAITVSPAIETIATLSEDSTISNIVKRSDCYYAKAPQCFVLKDIYEAHLKAQKDGNTEMIDSASLMKFYGHELHTVICSPENIKITTPADYYTFRALYEAHENSQILGLQ